LNALLADRGAWTAWQLWRHFGVRWLTSRAAYRLKLHSGWLARRTPNTAWDSPALEALFAEKSLAEPDAYLAYRRKEAPAFLFQPGQPADWRCHFDRWSDPLHDPVVQSRELLAGRLPLFGGRGVEIGFPPDWHRNPLSGHRSPQEAHWSRLPDFPGDDIKALWEPSRFSFVYSLVRAHARTGEACYAEAFWRLVESWRLANPPYRGAHWKCGQEASLRVMAWCCGLYGFLHSPASSPERVAALGRMVAMTGRRIAANLPYALSQQNNHGVSEGTGLWTMGLLFPEFSAARGWRETGRRVLEDGARQLIYDDGGFAQHSFNYQRLVLQLYTWSLQLGRRHGHDFSDALIQKVAAASRLLYDVQDGETGRVPCYGQNDGALALPLSNCGHDDYRPAVQAAWFTTSGTQLYPPGPWDEELLWLAGPDAQAAPRVAPQRTDRSAPDSGCYTLRSRDGFVFTHCGSFRHRPGQADMLHADLWWRGQNVALDPGTFSYNSSPPWNNPFAETAWHNTVTVDGEGQMVRAGRFVWLPWLRGQSRGPLRSAGGALGYWQGEHDGYRRLASPAEHRRGILAVGDGQWLILDDLRGSTPHDWCLHWLLLDVPYDWDAERKHLRLRTPAGEYHLQLQATVPAEVTLVRADPRTPRGWRARTYQWREPALSLQLRLTATGARVCSLFSPRMCQLSLDEADCLVHEGERDLSARLGSGSDGWLVRSALLRGPVCDELQISA